MANCTGSKGSTFLGLAASLQRMTDPRYSELARLLIEYSVTVQRGDHVLLDLIEVPDEFGVELMRAVRSPGFSAKLCGIRMENTPTCCGI
jgi:hypothetical protein